MKRTNPKADSMMTIRSFLRNILRAPEGSHFVQNRQIERFGRLKAPNIEGLHAILVAVQRLIISISLQVEGSQELVSLMQALARIPTASPSSSTSLSTGRQFLNPKIRSATPRYFLDHCAFPLLIFYSRPPLGPFKMANMR